MYARYSSFVLRWLKVPPEPHPPFGDPASLRVFRAGRNYYKLRLAGWAFAEALAFAGIIFWAVVFVTVEETARIEKARRAAVTQVTAAERARAAASPQAKAAPADPQTRQASGPPARKAPRKRGRVGGWDGFIGGFVELALLTPSWVFPILWLLKFAGLFLYLLQLPLTYAVRRLDYEMRWYVVTDRSLRIRTGVWTVQESTMSFANLQQVEVSQGPLQRLLGLADVKVQSAGGNDNPHGKPGHDDSLHTGRFHGVDNATEIRDLILERLRRFRESGLNDPDELRRAAVLSTAATAGGPPVSDDAEVLGAARELAAEARALREALS